MSRNYIADYIRRKAGPQSPISANVIADLFGVKPSYVRKAINAARREAIPICSSRWGYYYSTDRSDISKTVESMRGRIASQEAAIEGLASHLH